MVLGAPAGIVRNQFDAYELWEQGQTYRALETAMPAFLRNTMKGVRYAVDGSVINLKGYPITDVSFKDALMQIGGFTPSDVADKYARNNIMKESERKDAEKRASFLDAMYLAKMQSDFDEMESIQERLDRYNTTPLGSLNPIDGKMLDKSFKQREIKAQEAINGVILPKKLKDELMREAGVEYPE
jgi:hypothetical protein